MQKQKEFFLNVIAPICFICGYAYILGIHGHISVWQQRGIFLPLGLVRGFAGMSYGALCWQVLLPKIMKIKYRIRILLMGVCIMACISLIFCRNYISNSDLIMWVIIFGLLISIAYTIKLPLRWNRFCCELGGVSYPIFVFHYIVLQIVVNYFPYKTYFEKLIYVIGLLSIIILGKVLLQKGFKKIKRGEA